MGIHGFHSAAVNIVLLLYTVTYSYKVIIHRSIYRCLIIILCIQCGLVLDMQSKTACMYLGRRVLCTGLL